MTTPPFRISISGPDGPIKELLIEAVLNQLEHCQAVPCDEECNPFEATGRGLAEYASLGGLPVVVINADGPTTQCRLLPPPRIYEIIQGKLNFRTTQKGRLRFEGDVFTIEADDEYRQPIVAGLGPVIILPVEDGTTPTVKTYGPAH